MAHPAPLYEASGLGTLSNRSRLPNHVGDGAKAPAKVTICVEGRICAGCGTRVGKPVIDLAMHVSYADLHRGRHTIEKCSGLRKGRRRIKRRERLIGLQRSLQMRFLRQLLTYLGTLASHPAAFVIFALYAVLWFALDRESLNWHGVAALATWAMTLLIQRAEHRDTQAIHAKLDELLHAEKNARNAMAQIDEQEPEEIEELRRQRDRR